MRDEHYILDICDELLGGASIRQHRFSFLLGDTGRKLPVDGYYSDLNLVVEYKERQHSEPVPFFDHRMTVSGVSRGRQRAIYDQRRRDVIPKNNKQLIEFSYSEFRHYANKRLIRNEHLDMEIIRKKLESYGYLGK